MSGTDSLTSAGATFPRRRSSTAPDASVPAIWRPTQPQFDRVIARGMAKDPAERHPSAGDLGRAALAAAQGEQRTAPERSVAAGAAAPVAPPPPPVRPQAPRQNRPERRGPPERRSAATRVVHGRRPKRQLALTARHPALRVKCA